MRDASINPLKTHKSYAHEVQAPPIRISYRRSRVAAGFFCLGAECPAADRGIRLKRRLLPALNFGCISHLAWAVTTS